MACMFIASDPSGLTCFFSTYCFPHSDGMLCVDPQHNPKPFFTNLNVCEVFLTGVQTVFMLNFLSRLLILCWNGKITIPVSFLFP
jgi:hypothetical protein